MRTLVLSLLLAVPASGAFAQDVPRCQERRPGYVECEETRVSGAVPDSFLLLARSRVGHDPPPLWRDLVREVRRSVRRAPF